jgi:hypothetical protein
MFLFKKTDKQQTHDQISSMKRELVSGMVEVLWCASNEEPDVRGL